MSDPFKRGEANYAAFLTEDHVRELRQLRVAGSSYSQLAERFGIDKKHAWRICHRIAWAWLD